MNTICPVSATKRPFVSHLSRSCGMMLVAVLGLLLASCGKKGALDGTYSSSVQSITFKGDTASMSVMGKTVGDAWPYTVAGNQITFTGPGGNVVYTLNADGSISDPAKDKLVKK